MNNLRTPIAILVVIIVALGAWFWLSSRGPASVQMPASSVSTTSPQITPAQAAPAPLLDASTVAQNAIGTWQSTDDSNYTVVIGANGSWTDTYKGENASSGVSETGTYELFTSQDPDKNFTGILVPGVVYVKVTEGKDTLYYSVLQANSTTLQLSYLDRGNTLSFVRTQ